MIWISSLESVLDVKITYLVLCYLRLNLDAASLAGKRNPIWSLRSFGGQRCIRNDSSTLNNDQLVRTESSKELKRQTQPEHRCP